jgi:hypothetical protein
MRQMLEGGKDKATVMAAMINIHQPAEYWAEKATQAKASAEAANSPVNPPAPE